MLHSVTSGNYGGTHCSNKLLLSHDFLLSELLHKIFSLACFSKLLLSSFNFCSQVLID